MVYARFLHGGGRAEVKTFFHGHCRVKKERELLHGLCTVEATDGKSGVEIELERL
jgi:hypothetical protein